MNNQATPMTEHNANETRLYVAIELNRKKWKLGFSDGKVGRARIRSIEARDWQAFRVEIEKAQRQFVGRLDPDAVSERRQRAGTRHQPRGQSESTRDGHRDCPVLTAVSAEKPAEPMVPGAVWIRRSANAANRYRGDGETIGRGSVALCGIRDAARRRTTKKLEQPSKIEVDLRRPHRSGGL